MKKFLSIMACFTLVLLGATLFVACEKEAKSPVSFGVNGYFMNKQVAVKSYKWDKEKVSEEDSEKKIVETYVLKDGQQIENVTFGTGFEANNGKIVAICISTKGYENAKFGIVNLKTPDAEIQAVTPSDETTEAGEKVNDERFVQFVNVKAETKGVIIFVDWEGDNTYDAGYKFVIDGSKFINA